MGVIDLPSGILINHLRLQVVRANRNQVRAISGRTVVTVDDPVSDQVVGQVAFQATMGVSHIDEEIVLTNLIDKLAIGNQLRLPLDYPETLYKCLRLDPGQSLAVASCAWNIAEQGYAVTLTNTGSVAQLTENMWVGIDSRVVKVDQVLGTNEYVFRPTRNYASRVGLAVGVPGSIVTDWNERPTIASPQLRQLLKGEVNLSWVYRFEEYGA